MEAWRSGEPDKKFWLVKSSTRILGPYSADEIAQLVVEKQVSILDEVRQPQGRWFYIREHKFFEEIVRKLRLEQDHSIEATQTSATATISNTKTIEFSPQEDLTPTPAFTGSPQGPHQIKDVTSSAEAVVADRNPAKKVSAYVSSDDQRITQKIKKRNAVLTWTLISLSLLVVVAMVVHAQWKNRQQQESYQNILNEAVRARYGHLYDRALAFYRQAQTIKEAPFEVQYEMAIPLIAWERQTLKGRRILEEALIAGTMKREEQAQAYIGIGLSHLYDGDEGQAEEAYQKALGFEGQNRAALFNIATIRARHGQHEAAEEIYKNIHAEGASATQYALARAVNIAMAGTQSQIFAGARDVIDGLDSLTNSRAHNRTELLLVTAALQSLQQKSEEVEKILRRFLDTPPFQSNQYVIEILNDPRLTHWEQLDAVCSQLISRLNSPSGKAVRLRCLIESGKESETQTLLREALAENPRNEDFMALQAMSMWKSGRTREALAIVNLLPVDWQLRDYLLANLCLQQNDLDCSEGAYARLQVKAPQDPQADFGLAQIDLRRGRLDQAKERIRQGLRKEPEYLPLLELRDQLEANQ